MSKLPKTELQEALKHIELMISEVITNANQESKQENALLSNRKLFSLEISAQLLKTQLDEFPHNNIKDSRSAEDLFTELYHKLEWCILTFTELKQYKILNKGIIGEYMSFIYKNLYKSEKEIPSAELLIGRQKGFFTESVNGYLVTNIIELYRVDKIKNSEDSVLYTKLIKLLRKDFQGRNVEVNTINSALVNFNESIKLNTELINRFAIARNKLYSHHTNYDPKTIQTEYIRTSTGVSSTLKSETNISDSEIKDLLNPYIEMMNKLLSVMEHLGLQNYKALNLID